MKRLFREFPIKLTYFWFLFINFIIHLIFLPLAFKAIESNQLVYIVIGYFLYCFSILYYPERYQRGFIVTILYSLNNFFLTCYFFILSGLLFFGDQVVLGSFNFFFFIIIITSYVIKENKSRKRN